MRTDLQNWDARVPNEVKSGLGILKQKPGLSRLNRDARRPCRTVLGGEILGLQIAESSLKMSILPSTRYFVSF